jgi:uncharacterized protein YcnI
MLEGTEARKLGGWLTALVMGASAAAVEAHVTVLPREAQARTAPELTLRVPTERDVPTESVRVEFPEALEVLRLKPTAGWTAEFERDASGRIVAVTYSGSRIGPQEYQEFSLIVRLPEQTGPVRLRAFQRYAGGEEVAWVNEAEPRPAPLIGVTPPAGAVPAGADPFAAAAPSPAPASEVAAPAGTSGLSWMSGASLALSALAVILALRPRRGGAS